LFFRPYLRVPFWTFSHLVPRANCVQQFVFLGFIPPYLLTQWSTMVVTGLCQRRAVHNPALLSLLPLGHSGRVVVKVLFLPRPIGFLFFLSLDFSLSGWTFFLIFSFFRPPHNAVVFRRHPLLPRSAIRLCPLFISCETPDSDGFPCSSADNLCRCFPFLLSRYLSFFCAAVGGRQLDYATL